MRAVFGGLFLVFLLLVSMTVCMVATSTRGFALNSFIVLLLSYPVFVVGEDGSDQTWRAQSVVVSLLLFVAILYPVAIWLYYSEGLVEFVFNPDVPGVMKVDVLFAPAINAGFGAAVGFVLYHLSVGVRYRLRF